MTDLDAFRDHCRAMATAEHKPECCRCGKPWCCGCVGHPRYAPAYSARRWADHAVRCPRQPVRAALPRVRERRRPGAVDAARRRGGRLPRPAPDAVGGRMRRHHAHRIARSRPRRSQAGSYVTVVLLSPNGTFQEGEA